MMKHFKQKFVFGSCRGWPQILKDRGIRSFIFMMLFWLFFGPGFAEDIKIGSIRIVGNRVKTTADLLQILPFQPGDPLPSDWPEVLRTAILEDYHSQGYWLCRVDSVESHFNSDSTRQNLTAWIYEGPVLRIGSYSFVGTDQTHLREITRDLAVQPGQVYSRAAIEADIEAVLRQMESRGFPLAKIQPDSVLMDTRKDPPVLHLRFHVKPGKPVVFGRIKGQGNRVTRERVIARESRIRPGMLFDISKLDLARENLIRTDYFRKVDEPLLSFHDGVADVIFPVEEGSPNTLEGVIGYTPPRQDGKRGSFTGRINFDFQNLLGTGRLVRVYWEKKDEYSQAMQVAYEEPWLFGLPLFLGGRFEQEIRDTTYLERDWRLTTRFEPFSTLSLGLDIGQKSILPDSLSSAVQGLAQTKSWLLSGLIDYNTLDDPLNPRRGVHYQTIVTAGQKRKTGPEFLLTELGHPDPVTTRRIQMDVEVVVPLFRRQAFFAGLHGVEVKSGEAETPITEQERFGGATTLRGYREDIFRGDLVAWMNLEYRYFLGRRSRIFLFVDGGHFQRNDAALGKIRGQKAGYGFGIRLETRLGLMAIDYGLGEGDGLSQGKVHVGLVNRF